MSCCINLAEAAAAINVFPTDCARSSPPAKCSKLLRPCVDFFERLPNCSLHNHYGPSETHVVTAHRLSGPPAIWPARSPIGTPLPNCSVHIVDAALRPLADGEIGELLLGGVCVARAYVNRPELTTERFFQYGDPPEQVYRTGDLARRSADGTLEFLGRADDQVKIRGYRIELGEIEAALRSHPDVKLAAVAAHEAIAGRAAARRIYRAARRRCRRPTTCGASSPNDCRSYMVPGQFVPLDQLPLTPSGKSRSAITAHSRAQASRASPHVRSPAHDNGNGDREMHGAMCSGSIASASMTAFFDLGGSSLALTRVHARLRTQLRPFPIALLFQHPTIRNLAAAIG